MDSLHEIGLLLDFYGQLLTDRQYEILGLHYNDDYSLGEIAEQLNISRQGVFDNIKRGKTTLNNFEKKLSLVRRFTEQRSKAEEIINCFKSIDVNNLSDTDKELFSEIEIKIKKIFEDF